MSWKQVYNSGKYRALFLIAIMVGMIAISCKNQTETPKEETPAATPADAVKKASEDPVAPPTAETPKAEPEKQASAEPIILKDEGFSTPESVLYDAADDVYLVSNINGGVTDKDNNGFISRVGPDGKVATLKWIEGGKQGVTLNAPKGMAIRGEVLYVADIGTVRMFDRKTGGPMGQIDVKDAAFLNDLAAGSNGNLYLSDSGVKPTKKGLVSIGKDAVYKIDAENKISKLVSGKSLNQPNGLLADEGGVWVVTLGGNELYRVTDEGKRGPTRTLPSGGLDGLVKTRDGNLLISSWQASGIFSGSSEGEFVSKWANLKSPADIGYDAKRNRLLVPLFEENEIQIQPIQEMTAQTSAAPTPPSAEPAPAASGENAQAAASAAASDKKAATATQKGLRADAPEPEVAADKADDAKKAAAAAKGDTPATEPAKAAEPANAAKTPQKATPSSEKNAPEEK